jgi:hypothetical protein
MFPRPIGGTAAAGPLNAGDGQSLTLGDPSELGDLFTPNAGSASHGTFLSQSHYVVTSIGICSKMYTLMVNSCD